MRSRDILHGVEWANVRALYRASGYAAQEMEQPMIAVVNAYSTVCPGHALFPQLAARVREGIQAAGGTPVEFGVPGACDGVAMGHDGMKYVLPTRELIAGSIETMVEAHRLDGMLLLGSCDKIIPGMLMAAARLNLPALLLNEGPSLPGRMTENNPYGGEFIDHSIIQQAEGMLQDGRISAETFAWLEENAMPTAGSCAMLGTANTMGCLAEAMGMCLPGSSTIPAVYSSRLAAAYTSGKTIVEMVQAGRNARSILTRQALENAVRVNAAIGGSTNAVLHLLAIAYEADIPLDIFELGALSAPVPHLIPLIPAGDRTLLDLHEAGGIPAVLRELQPLLHNEALTCQGITLAEATAAVPPGKSGVVRSLSEPVHRRPGIAILRGNLAPDGAVTKPSAIPEKALRFRGPARIFENEADALRGIRAGEVKAGQVIVIRGEGPKGSPGMPEMYKPMKLLVGLGLGDKTCLVTDGRFSGSNNGCFVGHVCPEAAEDGPIAYLRDGDIISVDVEAGTIDAQVDFAARRAQITPPPLREVRGYLYQYRRQVRSASLGATLPVKE